MRCGDFGAKVLPFVAIAHLGDLVANVLQHVLHQVMCEGPDLFSMYHIEVQIGERVSMIPESVPMHSPTEGTGAFVKLAWCYALPVDAAAIATCLTPLLEQHARCTLCKTVAQVGMSMSGPCCLGGLGVYPNHALRAKQPQTTILRHSISKAECNTA